MLVMVREQAVRVLACQNAVYVLCTYSSLGRIVNLVERKCLCILQCWYGMTWKRNTLLSWTFLAKYVPCGWEEIGMQWPMSWLFSCPSCPVTKLQYFSYLLCFLNGENNNKGPQGMLPRHAIIPLIFVNHFWSIWDIFVGNFLIITTQVRNDSHSVVLTR